MKILYGLTFFFFSTAHAAVDLQQIEKDLAGAGVTGWIHGAAHDLRQYVFTYREPDDFFSHEEFSMIPVTAEARKAFSSLNRHDEVRITGHISEGSSPQKHIRVETIDIVARYESGVSTPPRTRTAKLPQELLSTTSLLGTVHAVAGEILVIEYKDAVVPVFVEDENLTEGLYRGDKVRLHYTVQKSPRLPVHLRLNAEVKDPLEVLERIVDQNGKQLVLEGSLVYFPQSPQIRFPIFALQVVDRRGLKLNYTLVNFEDSEVFEQIRNKLDGYWKEKTWSKSVVHKRRRLLPRRRWATETVTVKATPPIDARNCLVNPGIRIRARGIGNMVSPNQANPQLLLDSPASIERLP